MRAILSGLLGLCAACVGCGGTDSGTALGAEDASAKDSGAKGDTQAGDGAQDTGAGDASDAPSDTGKPETGYKCPTSPWATDYMMVPTVGAKTDRPAATHPDLNVKIRGFAPTGGTLGLIDVGGPTDSKAPRLYTMLVDSGTPTFVENFQVNNWDWTAMKVGAPISDPPVTMVAWETTPGQPIRLPKSGYTIAPGIGARVLFLDDDSITLKYTAEDNVVYGYTMHVLDLCIEPKLREVYDDAQTKGRGSLPGLAALQPFARARGDRVRVTIRDTDSFMDPRVKKAWYQP